MKARVLVGALVAAGVIGTGAAAYRGAFEAPLSRAVASPVAAAGVAAPVGNPLAASLPLNGFTELVSTYGPAVVNVSTRGTVKAGMQMPDSDEEGAQQPFNEFFRGFGGRAPRGAPRGGMPLAGQGSGFIVSADGYVLTNAHVVDSADEVTVKLNDRREFKAKVVGKDVATDVALLKIDAKGLPTVKLGSAAKAQVGEWVVAIGSPFGFESSVTAGIVSAKARSLPDAAYVPFLQTDVAVNPGNSGGPLFNLAGEVVGINSQIYSRTGGYQGLSFAIPIEVALNVKEQLLKNGKVSRGRLGVTVQEVNAALAESFGLDRPRGALVSAVEPSSPAEKGGVQVGDIITRYDGKAIERSADLPVLVAEVAPGHKADVEVWRKGGARSLTVTSAEIKGDRVARRGSENREAPSGRLGLSVRPLDPRENDGRGGLVVEEVGGAAARAGVQPGDVLLSFNGTPISSLEALREQVAKAGKRVALLVQREDRQIFVPLDLG